MNSDLRRWMRLVESDDQRMIEDFKLGLCYALAIEHHHRYGWPIYVIGGVEDGNRIVCVHGFVEPQTDLGLDVEGPRPALSLFREYVSPEEAADQPKQRGDSNEGWFYFPVSPQELLRSLARKPTPDDMRYAARAIDEYLRPKYPAIYPVK